LSGDWPGTIRTSRDRASRRRAAKATLSRKSLSSAATELVQTSCLVQRNLAVDLADDGVIFGLSGFEQLGDPGQTTGDVLHLGGVARDPSAVPFSNRLLVLGKVSHVLCPIP
jgi:hypothetical protein